MFTFRFIAGGAMNVVIFAGLLSLPAGTLEWWWAWFFIGLVFIEREVK